jgi:NAD(P)-dependent dehydrogenase (short-subunit alcohol dehydrogenase family)
VGQERTLRNNLEAGWDALGEGNWGAARACFEEALTAEETPEGLEGLGWAGMDFARARRFLDAYLMLPLHVARNAAGKVRPGGTLVFVGSTGARRPAVGLALMSAVHVGLPALVAGLALELAPVRVNLIAPGFVDTPLSASLLGDQLDGRRDERRDTLPIGRVVGPDDVAALAMHLMANTALTGATYDIDGGQQLLTRGV